MNINLLNQVFGLLVSYQEREMASPLDGKADGVFYADAKKYWSKVSPTVDGMLGGYSHISSTDIGGSARFLKHFLVSVSNPILSFLTEILVNPI